MIAKKDKIKALVVSVAVAITIFFFVKSKKEFEKQCQESRRSMIETVVKTMTENNKKCDVAPNIQRCFQMQIQRFYLLMEEVEQTLKDSGCPN